MKPWASVPRFTSETVATSSTRSGNPSRVASSRMPSRMLEPTDWWPKKTLRRETASRSERTCASSARAGENATDSAVAAAQAASVATSRRMESDALTVSPPGNPRPSRQKLA